MHLEYIPAVVVFDLTPMIGRFLFIRKRLNLELPSKDVTLIKALFFYYDFIGIGIGDLYLYYLRCIFWLFSGGLFSGYIEYVYMLGMGWVVWQQ